MLEKLRPEEMRMEEMQDINNVAALSKELDEYGVWVKSDPEAFSPIEWDIGKRDTENEEMGYELPDMVDALSIDDNALTFDEEDFSSIIDEPLFTTPSPSVASAPADVPDQGETPGVSSEVLLRIAEELSLIRSELSGIRTEMAREREEPVHEPLVKPEAPDDTPGEQEDDKITLTGDELNNIFTFVENSDAEEADGVAAADPVKAETPVDLDESLSIDLGSFDLSAFDTEAAPDTLKEEPAAAVPIDATSASLPDAPFPKAPSGKTMEIDDMFIENGSIKDMPIELDFEDGAEEGDVYLEQGEENESLNEAGEIELPMFEDLIVDNFRKEDHHDDDPPPFVGGAPESEKAEWEIGKEPVKQADAKNIESGGEKFGASLVHDLKGVLVYLDELLEALPEDKVEEFAESEHFDTYKRLFSQLGLT